MDGRNSVAYYCTLKKVAYVVFCRLNLTAGNLGSSVQGKGGGGGGIRSSTWVYIREFP